TAQEAAPGSGTVPSWQGITCDPIWVFFAPPFTMTVAEEEGLLLPSNTIHVLEPPVSCVFIPYFVDSWLGKWNASWGELFSVGTAKHDTDASGLGCHTLSLQSSTLESTDRTHEEATGIVNGHNHILKGGTPLAFGLVISHSVTDPHPTLKEISAPWQLGVGKLPVHTSIVCGHGAECLPT
ncbi:hypothetical protein QR98_0089620, partial [Sarcoptes scabiei]